MSSYMSYGSIRFQRRARAALKQAEAKPAVNLTLRRAEVQIRVRGGLVDNGPTARGRVFSVDMTARGTSIFTEQPLQLGQSVALTFEEPLAFFVRARVVACRRQSLDVNIFSEKVFGYRVRVDFEYSSARELLEVRNFATRFRRQFA